MIDNKSNFQLPVNTIIKHIKTLYDERRYAESLDRCLQITQAYPKLWKTWYWAETNCIHLQRWQDAIGYAHMALAHGGVDFGIYDGLAHAHGELKQLNAARRYGLLALDMRDRQFGGQPVIGLPEPGPVPPPPSAPTRTHNIIAFSLFGADPKYCESAILNVQEQPRIYPHWVCRFYVDDSVPENVIARLRQGGAQIVPVEQPAAQWPGPMWRLLALNDPLAHRILFRDADSVISRREATAVEQWVASGKRFHMMRDHSANTELILAGLWGVVSGSLPPLENLIVRFMSAPLASRHFADQYFLRQYIWPYARTSLMQHDSVFGFMGGLPFPDTEKTKDFYVGCAENVASISVKINLPDQSEVVCKLYLFEKQNDDHITAELVSSIPVTLLEHDEDNNPETQELACNYTNFVQNSVVTMFFPLRYIRRLQRGTARICLVPKPAA